jgi:hypothetical protein
VECPKCASELKVSNKFYAGPSANTRRLECTGVGCRVVFTSVELIVGENESRGQGAYSVARKLNEGKLVVKVEEKGG